MRHYKKSTNMKGALTSNCDNVLTEVVLGAVHRIVEKAQGFS